MKGRRLKEVLARVDRFVKELNDFVASEQFVHDLRGVHADVLQATSVVAGYVVLKTEHLRRLPHSIPFCRDRDIARSAREEY